MRDLEPTRLAELEACVYSIAKAMRDNPQADFNLHDFEITRLLNLVGLTTGLETPTKRGDPPGCGCTDCLTGYSIPGPEAP